MTKTRVIIPFDYEALEVQTSEAFIKKVKRECDSERFGFINTIERFEIEYSELSDQVFSVLILSRERYIGGNSRGELYCHYFSFDRDDPSQIYHKHVNYFLINKFKRLSTGIKDD